ncbi:MAG: 3-oxoacyl-ACP reductase [Candidatus Hydrogenedentota bacterium]
MGSLLAGQVAIITGAGRGIGEAAARQMGKEGASVIVSDLDEKVADAVAASIQNDGGKAIAVSGDVTDPAFPDRVFEAATAAFGQVTVLVNNAGYTWDGVIHKMTDEQWQAMIDVHATAPFRLVRAAAKYMRDVAKEELMAGQTPRYRTIINISSTSGLHGNGGQANYATAKMGIIGLTKTVAKEWGSFGITCNAVAFGFIDTRLTRPKEEGAAITVQGKEIPLGIPSGMRDMIPMLIPLNRPGTAEEAAGGIVMMASPYARYITGHVLEVTGGFGM